MLKFQQVETRLEEIISTASYFLHRTQDILEILQGRLTWLETTKEPPVNAPIKDSERVKLEYELVEFGNKAAEELVKEAWRTERVCTEFCRKVLTTYNRCQTSAKKRLDKLPKHEEYLKQLQVRWQEDELGIQLIKSLDEREMRIVIAQAAVRNHILEDQLRLIPSRMEYIKSQVANHEFTIRFLEPSEFETIVRDANVWKQFINEVVGTT